MVSVCVGGGGGEEEQPEFLKLFNVTCAHIFNFQVETYFYDTGTVYYTSKPHVPLVLYWELINYTFWMLILLVNRTVECHLSNHFVGCLNMSDN